MKRILTMSLFLFISLFVAGQPSLFHTASANQQLIEEFVGNGLFLLRQDYQIKDTATGKYYGRGGDVFGSIYALGIKLQGGYCLSDRGVRPWEYDEHFNDYRKGYIPVMYKTYRRELTDTAMTGCPQWGDKRMRELLLGKFSYVADSLFGGDGFETDLTAGRKKGWLVWVVSKKAIAEAAPQTSVSYAIYRKELDIRDGAGEYVIDAPSVDQKVWGGIYVVPVQTAVGQITFRLVGVVDRWGDQWIVFTPFEKLLSPVSVVSDGKSMLTPVEREEKTKVAEESGKQDEVKEKDIKGKTKKPKK